MPRFTREPTAYLAVLQAALAVVVTFAWDGLSAEQAALITAFVGAVCAAANAALVRPIVPGAFVQLVGSGAALLAAYGLNLPTETVGTIQALVVAVVAMQARQQVTPVADPRPAEQVVG
jgi:hypothetical protein